jgi:hypothetical protein
MPRPLNGNSFPFLRPTALTSPRQWAGWEDVHAPNDLANMKSNQNQLMVSISLRNLAYKNRGLNANDTNLGYLTLCRETVR